MGFNDFHGRIEPSTLSALPVGGAEVITTWAGHGPGPDPVAGVAELVSKAAAAVNRW